LARSDPEPARGAALRLEGADQRVHGAPVHQTVLEADPDPQVGLRERRRAVGPAWLHGPAAEALGVGRLMGETEVGRRANEGVWGEAERVPPRGDKCR